MFKGCYSWQQEEALHSDTRAHDSSVVDEGSGTGADTGVGVGADTDAEPSGQIDGSGINPELSSNERRFQYRLLRYTFVYFVR